MKKSKMKSVKSVKYCHQKDKVLYIRVKKKKFVKMGAIFDTFDTFRFLSI
jgi:hypothetical protein